MKSFFKNWLTDGHNIKDYVPTGIFTNEPINEKVFLKLPRNNLIEVSQYQWTLAYNPVVVGIAIKKKYSELTTYENNIELIYCWENSDTILANSKLKFIESLDLKSDYKLILFQAIQSKCSQLNLVRRLSILLKLYTDCKKKKKYFGSLSFNLYQQYVSQFTYPRKVVLMSVKFEDHYSIFPIDLIGHLPETRSFVFGLRNSNNAIEQLRKVKRVVISEIPAEYYKIVYSLGKFLSEKSPDKGVFKIKSEKFNFDILNITSAYKEMLILNDQNIGSQQLFVGEVVNEVIIDDSKPLFYHQHFLQFLERVEREKTYYLPD